MKAIRVYYSVVYAGLAAAYTFGDATLDVVVPAIWPWLFSAVAAVNIESVRRGTGPRIALALALPAALGVVRALNLLFFATSADASQRLVAEQRLVGAGLWLMPLVIALDWDGKTDE